MTVPQLLVERATELASGDGWELVDLWQPATVAMTGNAPVECDWAALVTVGSESWLVTSLGTPDEWRQVLGCTERADGVELIGSDATTWFTVLPRYRSEMRSEPR